MKSKIISLSAVSAGLVAIALLIGAFIEFADLFTLVIASVFVMVPLYYNSFKGAFLCAISGGVIAFLCSGLNILSLVFPAYFAFFAFYPIVWYKLAQKNVKKHFTFIIGLIWCVLAMYGCYFYYTLVMHGMIDDLPAWLIDYVLYIVGLVAIIFYIVYYRFVVLIKITIDRYLSRIIK